MSYTSDISHYNDSTDNNSWGLMVETPDVQVSVTLLDEGLRIFKCSPYQILGMVVTLSYEQLWSVCDVIHEWT